MSCPLRRLGTFGTIPFLTALSLLILPDSSEGQLVVDRLEVFLTESGGAAFGTFAVSNASDASVTGQLLLSDWERREDGMNVFLDPGTVEGSCHPDVQIFPSLLLLAPGEMQIVEVSYSGPPLATSCWTSVRVAPTPAPAPTPDDGGARVNVEIHQYVKVYVEPPNGWGDVEILDADVLPAEPDPRGGREPESEFDVLAVVTNPGTVQLWISGVVEYRTLDNTVVARSPFPEAPILPGAVRRMRVPLPELPPGAYVVLVLLDGGGAELAAAQIDLEIGP